MTWSIISRQTKHLASVLKRIDHCLAVATTNASQAQPCSASYEEPYPSSSHPLHCVFVVVPFAPFGVPVWKPFLNFLGISFIDRIRPVPVVFLLFAFMPQLSVMAVLVGVSLCDGGVEEGVH